MFCVHSTHHGVTEAVTSVRGLSREGKSRKSAELSHRFQKKNRLSFCSFPPALFLQLACPKAQCVKFKSVSVRSSLGSRTAGAHAEVQAALKSTRQVSLGSGLDESQHQPFVCVALLSGRRQESRGARETRPETLLGKVRPGVKFSAPWGCSKGPPSGSPMLATEYRRPPVGSFSHLVRWAPEALTLISCTVAGFVPHEGWARGNCPNV